MMTGANPEIPGIPKTVLTTDIQSESRIRGKSTRATVCSSTASAVKITPEMTAAEVISPRTIIKPDMVGVIFFIKAAIPDTNSSASPNAPSVTAKTALAMQTMPTRSMEIASPDEATVRLTIPSTAQRISTPSSMAKFLAASGAASATIRIKVSVKKLKSKRSSTSEAAKFSVFSGKYSRIPSGTVTFTLSVSMGSAAQTVAPHTKNKKRASKTAPANPLFFISKTLLSTISAFQRSASIRKE